MIVDLEAEKSSNTDCVDNNSKNDDLFQAQEKLKQAKAELEKSKDDHQKNIENSRSLVDLKVLSIEAPNLETDPGLYVDHSNIEICKLAHSYLNLHDAQTKFNETEALVYKLTSNVQPDDLSMIEIISRMRRHENIIEEKKSQISRMEQEIKTVRDLAASQATQIEELEEKLSKIGNLSNKKARLSESVLDDINSNIMNYKLTNELKGHTDCVWDIATSLDGDFIVASGHDHSVRSWRYNGATWENGFTFSEHTNFVKAVDCRVVNGKLLIASASHDNTIKCWDGQNGGCIWSKNHTNSVLGCTIGDRLIVSAGFNEKTYRIWEVNSGSEVRTISNAFQHTSVYVRFRDPVTCQQIVTGGNESSNSGMMKVFDTETGSLVLTSDGNHNGWIWRVVVSDDAQFAITSSYVHKLIKVWDLNNGELVRTISGHIGGVYQLNTCRYHYLVSAGEDKNVNVWNWVTAQCINSFPAKSSAFRGASCSPDGRWICGGGGDRSVFLWSL